MKTIWFLRNLYGNILLPGCRVKFCSQFGHNMEYFEFSKGHIQLFISLRLTQTLNFTPFSGYFNIWEFWIWNWLLVFAKVKYFEFSKGHMHFFISLMLTRTLNFTPFSKYSILGILDRPAICIFILFWGHYISFFREAIWHFVLFFCWLYLFLHHFQKIHFQDFKLMTLIPSQICSKRQLYFLFDIYTIFYSSLMMGKDERSLQLHQQSLKAKYSNVLPNQKQLMKKWTEPFLSAKTSFQQRMCLVPEHLPRESQVCGKWINK